MVRKYFCTILFLIFTSAAISQQVPEVSVSVDTTDYLVGDYIHYRANILHQEDVDILFPPLESVLADLEIISSSDTTLVPEEGMLLTVFDYTLAGYDSGAAKIPSYEIQFRAPGDEHNRFLITDSIMVSIHTVPVDTTKDIKKIEDPVELPYDLMELLPWIGAALLLLALLFYLYLRWRKKKGDAPEKKKIKIPYYKRALIALGELEDKKLWQQNRVKEYHTEITTIIRQYFEDRFNIRAMESTTGELLTRLRVTPGAQEIYEETEGFLNNADMVKFAKFEPMADVNIKMMEQAKDIVEKTIPKPEDEEKGEDDNADI